MILLSWDGTRPDYLERGSFPALSRMRSEGASAERLTPVFPPDTFPNHVALATGAPVDRHGIIQNAFRDRDRGGFRYANDASWLEAEPLWAAAERQGVRAAVFFWVGSETDWRGVGASFRKAPFDSKVPESEKVDQILRWLALPEPERPRLLMSWWHGADHVGHAKGPEHADIARALATQDRQLGRLLAALDERNAWPYTTLIVVSDHGMAEVSESLDPGAELRAHDIGADVVAGGGTAQVYLADLAQRERAREVLSQLDGVRVFAGAELPKQLRAFHPRRTGDLVLLTSPPRTFQRAPARAFFGLFSVRFGAHGYDPELPEMGALLLAMGRGVPAGAKLGTPRAIDVAPTIARLLAIDPPRDSEGSPLPGIVPVPNP